MNNSACRQRYFILIFTYLFLHYHKEVAVSCKLHKSEIKILEIIEIESEMVLFVIVKHIKAFYSCIIHFMEFALELWTYIENILILDLRRISNYHFISFPKNIVIILIIYLSIFIYSCIIVATYFADGSNVYCKACLLSVCWLLRHLCRKIKSLIYTFPSICFCHLSLRRSKNYVFQISNIFFCFCIAMDEIWYLSGK